MVRHTLVVHRLQLGVSLLIVTSQLSSPVSSAAVVAAQENVDSASIPADSDALQTSETPTASSEPTSTPVETDTPGPVPSDTPEPSPTPAPTETDTPSPSAVPSPNETPTETPTPPPTPTEPPVEPIGAVILIEPSGTISTEVPTYHWEAQQAATRYQLEVTGPDGIAIQTWYAATDVCADLVCAVSPDTLLTEGTYTWRVQTGSQETEGIWSDSLNFSVDLTPEAPVPLEPTGTIQVTQPEFVWQPVELATAYRLSIQSGNEIISELWYEADQVCSDQDCRAMPDNSLAPGTYAWRVQARNREAHVGPWSPPLTMTIDLVTPQLHVQANIAPDVVTPGEAATVTITVQNTGRVEAQGIRLRNALPAGLHFVPGETGPSQPGRERRGGPQPDEHGELVFEVGSLAAGQDIILTYQLRADAPSEAAVLITDIIQVSAAGLEVPLLASTDLTVVGSGARWSSIHADSASVVQAGGVRLDIPAGAYTGADGMVLVWATAERRPAHRSPELLAEFELTLYADCRCSTPGRLEEARRSALPDQAQTGAGGGRPVDPERPDIALHRALDEQRALSEQAASFGQPFSLTVSFDGMADLEALWMDQAPFVAVWDEAAQVWVRQPLDTIDVVHNTVVLEATHFSTWGAGIGGTFPTNGASIPLYDEARVSVFTGRATYGYPLWIPAGRADMTPEIALAYSSGTVDGILGDVQSPWVGTGWNIDSAEITRVILNGSCGSSCGSGVYGYDDRYLLTFNGTGFPLVEDPQHPGRYHTAEESFLYIQRHNTALDNEKDNGQSPANETDEWWEIVTADGTRYRLGWNADSEQLAPMKGYNGEPNIQRNPVFEDGADYGWDASSVTGVSVLSNGDETFQMWYAAEDASGITRIGTAGGAGGAEWTRIGPYDAAMLEAEESTLTLPMIRSSHDSASGCEFTFTPDDNGANDGQGSAEFTFSLAQTGPTYFWAHVWNYAEFYVSLDGGTESTWLAQRPIPPAQYFLWESITGINGQSLSAGQHTLRIRTKADGSALDAVMVSQDSALRPLNTYCGSAPVLDVGPSTAWDDVDLGSPEVILADGIYHMWFAGFDGSKWRIGYATSADGEHWTKYNDPATGGEFGHSDPVLAGSAGAWDQNGVSEPSVLYEDGTFFLWYAGQGSDGLWQIGYATSPDGIHWTKPTSAPVLTRQAGTWYASSVRGPDVLKIGSTYQMWLEGQSASGSQIGIATSSDKTTWTVSASSPISQTGWWASANLHDPAVTLDGNRYRVWYAGGAVVRDVGYAVADSDPLSPASWTNLPAKTANAWNDLGYAGAASDRVAQRWRVDLVADVYGNTISYTYFEETREIAGLTGVIYDRASYLDTIRYTGSGGVACDPVSAACYEVRFIRADRGADPQNPLDMPVQEDLEEWDTWDQFYLDRVDIYSLTSANQTLLRTYDLNYHEIARQDSDGDPETWDSLALDEIVTTAPDGESTLTAPKISFTYQNFDNRAQTLNEPEWGYPRLTSIQNGTEGSVTFTYGEDGRPASQYYAWRVLWREGRDGVTNEVTRTDYNYGPACYQDATHGWCNPGREGALLGHEWTAEIAKDFDGDTLSRIKHLYRTVEDEAGREYRTETSNADDTLQFASETDYTTIDWTINSDFPEDVRFTYAHETREYERQGTSLELLTRTTYNYDDAWGDLFSTSRYDGEGVLLSTVDYTYLRNDVLHLHSFARSTITRDIDGKILSALYYAYDGTPGGLGSRGELTLQQTRTLETQASTETLDTTFTYDSYGNLVETRAYGTYGAVGVLPTSNETLDRVTSMGYDDVYHTFLASLTNPLGHTSSTLYDFDLGEPPLGVARRVTDPNGAVIETQYDALGRSVSVWQPGFTPATLPSGNIHTIYPDVNASGQIAAPYSVEMQIWDDGGPGGDQYRHAWAFYDGWGRTLRTVGPAEDVDRYIQSDTWYNALGLVGRSARPYEVTLSTPPGAWSTPNWLALKTTTTRYDGFGRIISVEAPDGATVQTLYAGRETTVIDANWHRRTSVVDDFGRLVTVREYSGTGQAGDGYLLYASTTYSYDTRNLLIGVTDAQSNQTTIGYDGLGRKASLADPDMGSWTYSYDLWGQLDIQTDARGAQVRFEYDKLGRVTTRQARLSSAEPWATVANSTYDTATNGIGRLASAASVYVNGLPTVTDVVSYDVMGHTIMSARAIVGVGAGDYTVTSTYDSLGRIQSITYPDPDGAGPLVAETVTTTYNARGLPEATLGSDRDGEGPLGADTYVAFIDYTATGSVDRQTLGNGVITDFTYYEDSNRLSRLYVAKSGYLALLDLRYAYDDGGNISQIEDPIHGEVRGYEYDHLNRLTFAQVNSASQMLEERYYSYDQLGNLLSFRRRYPAAQQGRGAVLPGGNGDTDVYQGRGSFNGISGRSTESTQFSGSALSPYVFGQFAVPPLGVGFFGRSSVAPGAANSVGRESRGAAGFNPMAGIGGTDDYQGRGITPFVRGVSGLMSGGSGGGYSGPTGELIQIYTYGEGSAGPHAVTSRANNPGSVDRFVYDANGNMTSRTMNGVTWTHTFDAENRLIRVDDGVTETTYVYDGTGGRVKRIADNGTTTTTTLYVAGMEIQFENGAETRRTMTYPGGAFRILGGEDAGLYFSHSDHLGSTSVLSSATGQKVTGSDVVYAPFGEVRSGELPAITDFGFTGQRLDRSTSGLMYYGARYYLPELRRFVSPDSMVPGAANSQAFNRYSYVLNNPTRFTDPSGHSAICSKKLNVCSDDFYESPGGSGGSSGGSGSLSGGSGGGTGDSDSPTGAGIYDCNPSSVVPGLMHCTFYPDNRPVGPPPDPVCNSDGTICSDEGYDFQVIPIQNRHLAPGLQNPELGYPSWCNPKTPHPSGTDWGCNDPNYCERHNNCVGLQSPPNWECNPARGETCPSEQPSNPTYPGPADPYEISGTCAYIADGDCRDYCFNDYNVNGNYNCDSEGRPELDPFLNVGRACTHNYDCFTWFSTHAHERFGYVGAGDFWVDFPCAIASSSPRCTLGVR